MTDNISLLCDYLPRMEASNWPLGSLWVSRSTLFTQYLVLWPILEYIFIFYRHEVFRSKDDPHFFKHPQNPFFSQTYNSCSNCNIFLLYYLGTNCIFLTIVVVVVTKAVMTTKVCGQCDVSLSTSQSFVYKTYKMKLCNMSVCTSAPYVAWCTHYI